MADTRSKYVTPAIDQTAFNCPHCGVLTTQTWYKPRAQRLDSDQKPLSASSEAIATHFQRLLSDNKNGEEVRAWVKSVLSRRPFPHKLDSSAYSNSVTFRSPGAFTARI